MGLVENEMGLAESEMGLVENEMGLAESGMGTKPRCGVAWSSATLHRINCKKGAGRLTGLGWP